MTFAPVRLYLSLFLLMCTGALFPMLINGPTDFRDFVADRSPLLYVVQICLHGAILFFAVQSLDNMWERLLQPIPALLLGWCLASIIWSGDPLRTSMIVSLLIAEFMIATYVATVMTMDQFFRVLRNTLILLTVLCVLFAVFVPSYGRMTIVFPGVWQGVFTHKNILGQFCALSYSVFLVEFGRRRTLGRLILLVSSAFLAVKSESSTAALAMLASTAVYLWVSLPALARLLCSFSILPVVLVLVLQFDVLDLMLVVLGKSETLSGRTTVWWLAWQAILSHPFLGYGLGVFWTTEEAASIRQVAGWTVPHAHNALLEVLLQVGITGLLLYSLLLAKALRNALRMLRTELYARCFPIVIMPAIIVLAMAEIRFLDINSIFQFLIFYLATLDPNREVGSVKGNAEIAHHPVDTVGSYPAPRKEVVK